MKDEQVGQLKRAALAWMPPIEGMEAESDFTLGIHFKCVFNNFFFSFSIAPSPLACFKSSGCL